ncbi:hypothetical protein [Pararoseomonas baculiformis]|uniref:hypothetical protein n=1 Tax=Pararoseomonas baculiformis TaxID=2820812 RepID=UPI001AE0474C|nr:hypothetical protein [Pararoseomonas baculiformis]
MGLGAVSAVLDHSNAVRQGLRFDGGRHWRPLLRQEDSAVITQSWAAGFMFAFKRLPAP